MNMNRVRYLDIAKGISLLLVMISHSCGMPYGMGKYFTAFYIQIFFVLSGLTYKSGRAIGPNIIKRARGVIIPYVLYGFIIIGINILLRNVKTIKEFVDAVIGMFYSRYCFYPIDYESENIYFLQIGNSPLWFLTAMFVSSCIFYVLVECIKESKLHLCIYGICLIILTVALEHSPILLPWSVDTSFMGAFFMLIGYYGKNIYLQEKKWKLLVPVTVIYLVCCHFNTGINISIREYGDYGLGSVIAVCIIGITGSLLYIYFSEIVNLIPVIRDIFDYIGRNTIMLLALHVSIFNIFDGILKWFGISEDVNGIVYYGVGIIRLSVTVGVCFCMTCFKKRWIEKAVV